MPEQVAQSEIVKSPEDILNQLETNNQRLLVEIDDHAGSSSYPEWYSSTGNDERSLLNSIINTNIDPKVTLGYYNVECNYRVMAAKITGRGFQLGVVNGLHNSFLPISGDKLGAAMREEALDGGMHAEVLKAITPVEGDIMNCSAELNTLRAYYGLSSVTELLAISGEGFDDQIHAAIRTPQVLKQLRLIDVKKFSAESDTFNTQIDKWATHSVTALGVDAKNAIKYTHGISRRYDSYTENNEGPVIRTVDRFNHFGLERIEHLAEETGIHAVDAYSMEQLERMEDLITNPGSFAEQVANKDVTVVMINRVGDHNGVLRSTAESFEDDTDSITLFFEIDEMTDIHKNISKLQNWGIKPSTIVLSAHSAKGNFVVANELAPGGKKMELATVTGRMAVAAANGLSPELRGPTTYAIEQASDWAQLVDTAMKSSNQDDKRKIIFQACYAGSESEVTELDAEGNAQVIGENSVIGAVADLLLKNAKQQNFEVFGVDGPMQLHRSKEGVSFTGAPASMGEKRQHVQVVKISATPSGVARENIDEIVLRSS